MKYKSKILSIFSLLLLCLTQTSCAQPVPEASEPLLLSNAKGENNHLNGIGQILRGDRRYCTAFLLDTRDGDSNAKGPAYALTSAHCASIRMGTAVDTSYQGQVQFNYFQDTLEGAKRYDIQKVKWASLAGTDVAIMQLESSLETLLDDGINPLKTASTTPDNPTQVQVVGAPASAPGLRLSACTQEQANTTLIKFSTVHTRYQKQNCKGIEPGSSGSAVLDATTGEVTGVMSGTTYGIPADDLCFWHGLCGNHDSRSILPDQASQSFAVDYLMSCFTDGSFNIDASACRLKPNFDFRSRTHTDIALHKTPADSDIKTPNWDIKYSMNTNFYRSKTVRDARSCYSPEHYNGAISTLGGMIDTPIGREAGLYYLCVVGTDSVEQQLTVGSLENIQVLAARLVDAVERRLPEPTPEFTPGADYLLIKYRETDDRNIWTQIYGGPVGTTDCAAIDSMPYSKIGDSFLVPLDALPLTLCSYTMDRNLSTSEVRTDLLQSSGTD
ncbi:trypsin-like peptidase domain-containing protein [Pseudomonas sp. NPDC098747]|uniref:trypsin-like peptidase domain-containing protein n=1 Tax=Pseudomonas sp. NPDC098747 TaxID=3364487 RepID=UPI00383A60E7